MRKSRAERSWVETHGYHLSRVETRSDPVCDVAGRDELVERLVNDIMEMYPPGVLPPIEQLSMRPKEDVEAVMKGPFEEGGRHIYTLAYPP